MECMYTHLLPLHPARSDADAAVSSGLRPGQCITRIPAIAEQGENLQAKTAGLPGGPAETSPACSEASEQGDETWTSQFRNCYMKRFLWLNCSPYVCFIQGSAIQKEVRGSRRAGAGEDLRVWENEIVGTSRVSRHLQCCIDINIQV